MARFQPDATALTTSFYSTARSSYVDLADIDHLRQLSAASNEPSRFCLHQSADDELHSMVIVQPATTYAPPRKHPHRAKILHIVSGAMVVVSFTDDGQVRTTQHLDTTGRVIVLLEPGVFHTNVAVSPFATYHEVISGPFVRESADRIYADFAPPDDEPTAGLAYLRHAIQHFDSTAPVVREE